MWTQLVRLIVEIEQENSHWRRRLFGEHVERPPTIPGLPDAIYAYYVERSLSARQVESGSISERAGLVRGQRIIEVNGEPLLGATQEARDDNSPLGVEVSSSNPLVSSSPVFSPHGASTPSVVSPILSSHEQPSTRVDEVLKEEAPLASSSPLPATITAPNVAPPAPPVKESTPENPERLAFSSKLSHFEKKMEEASMIPRPTHIPEKKRLLNEDDIARLKEAEEKGVAATLASPAQEENDDFLAMIEESQTVRGPGSIRTKKAEKRAIAAGLIEDENVGLTESERMEREAAKRELWRKERLASVVSKQHDAVSEDDGRDEKVSSSLDEIQYADEEL